MGVKDRNYKRLLLWYFLNFNVNKTITTNYINSFLPLNMSSWDEILGCKINTMSRNGPKRRAMDRLIWKKTKYIDVWMSTVKKMTLKIMLHAYTNSKGTCSCTDQTARMRAVWSEPELLVLGVWSLGIQQFSNWFAWMPYRPVLVLQVANALCTIYFLDCLFFRLFHHIDPSWKTI